MDWLPYRKWGFPVISGLRGMSKIRTCGTWIFSPLLYLLSYHTKFEVENSSVLLGKTQLVIISDGLSIILLMVNSFLKGTTRL